ncbi:MAG: membrane lipoprotein lipid attachment site-containing protein [Erysipelotrichaceae bacterium]|nr:membrane lipoprotein lipid attachment site-containing protein [Erysipelotrichaceae bacterium]
MKRLLLILLAVFMLTGCGKLSDEQRFAKEYGLDDPGDLAVRYIADKKELLEELVNGTRVILISHPDEEINEDVRTIVKNSSNFSGVYVYYFDRQKVDDELEQQIWQTATPYISEDYMQGEKLLVYFRKYGEIFDYLTGSDIKKLDISLTEKVNNTLNEMLKDLRPGCNEC